MQKLFVGKLVTYVLALPAFLGLLATSAYAHHPLGGDVPQTFAHGLLSGIGHPIIGLDHLAFVVALGVAMALAGGRMRAYLPFVVASVVGTGLLSVGIGFGLTEWAVSISVIALGFCIMQNRFPNALVGGSLLAVAGLCHGFAYGQAIIGAETSVLFAYLLGFAFIQSLIAVSVCLIARRIMTAGDLLMPRLAGAAVFGIGLTYLVELGESAIF